MKKSNKLEIIEKRSRKRVKLKYQISSENSKDLNNS